MLTTRAELADALYTNFPPCSNPIVDALNLHLAPLQFKSRNDGNMPTTSANSFQLFSSNFWDTPGISRQKSRNIRPKGFVSLAVEGHTELLGPQPFTCKTPRPKSLGLCSFSCLKSRLTFSILTCRISHKQKGPWWVARLKISFSLENFHPGGRS